MSSIVLGQILGLVGMSKKGKQRTKEFGNTWRVLHTVDTVLFSEEKGPWLFIESVGPYEPQVIMRSARWIHSLYDKDFIISRVF